MVAFGAKVINGRARVIDLCVIGRRGGGAHRHAAECGADGVMVPTIFEGPTDDRSIVDFYSTVSEAGCRHWLQRASGRGRRSDPVAVSPVERDSELRLGRGQQWRPCRPSLLVDSHWAAYDEWPTAGAYALFAGAAFDLGRGEHGAAIALPWWMRDETGLDTCPGDAAVDRAGDVVDLAGVTYVQSVFTGAEIGRLWGGESASAAGAFVRR